MITIDRNAFSWDLFFLSHIQYVIFIVNFVYKCGTPYAEDMSISFIYKKFGNPYFSFYFWNPYAFPHIIPKKRATMALYRCPCITHQIYLAKSTAGAIHQINIERGSLDNATCNISMFCHRTEEDFKFLHYMYISI